MSYQNGSQPVSIRLRLLVLLPGICSCTRLADDLWNAGLLRIWTYLMTLTVMAARLLASKAFFRVHSS